MKEFEVYIGVLLKVRADSEGEAVKKAKEVCPDFIKKIPLSEDAIIKKKAFYEVRDTSDTICIHDVSVWSGAYVTGFEITDDKKCKNCVANINNRCTTNIIITKMPEVHDGECMGYNRG